MTRTAWGLCVAAAFGFAVSAGAQSSTTDMNRSMSKSGNEITVTGCLEKGANGNYILTNAEESTSPSSSASASGTTSGTTATGTTATGTTTGTSGAYGSSASKSMEHASTWTLEGGKDLDRHVGHKIQVTGKEVASSSSSSYGSTNPSSTSGTTTGSSTTGSTATGTTGTTAAGSASESSTSAHRLDVTSVKMVSTSCR